MRYTLVVTKTDANPNYAVEVAEFEKRTSSYGRNNFEDRGPLKEVTTNALVCELTEDQFKAVKAECIKVFV